MLHITLEHLYTMQFHLFTYDKSDLGYHFCLTLLYSQSNIDKTNVKILFIIADH